MSSLRRYLQNTPQIGNNVYLDESSVIIGKVVIGEDCSVWPGAVIRGDVNTITIGKRTNIQDLSTLHVSTPSKQNPQGYPLLLGDDVSIGHRVILHGCTIKDSVLVGMGAIVLDGALIESDVLIGAGSLVPSGKQLASGFLYFGSPVKKIRALSADEIMEIKQLALHYVGVKNQY